MIRMGLDAAAARLPYAVVGMALGLASLTFGRGAHAAEASAAPPAHTAALAQTAHTATHSSAVREYVRPAPHTEVATLRLYAGDGVNTASVQVFIDDATVGDNGHALDAAIPIKAGAHRIRIEQRVLGDDLQIDELSISLGPGDTYEHTIEARPIKSAAVSSGCCAKNEGSPKQTRLGGLGAVCMLGAVLLRRKKT